MDIFTGAYVERCKNSYQPGQEAVSVLKNMENMENLD